MIFVLVCFSQTPLFVSFSSAFDFRYRFSFDCRSNTGYTSIFYVCLPTISVYPFEYNVHVSYYILKNKPVLSNAVFQIRGCFCTKCFLRGICTATTPMKGIYTRTNGNVFFFFTDFFAYKTYDSRCTLACFSVRWTSFRSHTNGASFCADEGMPVFTDQKNKEKRVFCFIIVIHHTETDLSAQRIDVGGKAKRTEILHYTAVFV